MFQYKTKGMTSPQGKRRVYFTCHPDDHGRFFEQISAELLGITDCAVWYSTDDEYEDIDTDLGQMNLLVVPITTRLLTKPCRARDTDVPFALKHHIPILPLMQEDGLDELYGRHFGDLHYLDPNARDDTALSYGEKLKKYLNSVLVGDELAAKVRDAFDAYIFLSYRKKDRKYANELMRLIHKNDFCRDIAIWYDEYLVPGHNFKQAISAALQRSDLFALVVTPNLVNEKNYVEEVEYPAAVEQNKPILPVELKKTDRIALSAHYRDIPNSIDARDETALAEALESALARIARRENASDPQHNFFIGLAYLDGIDVEVDHGRALSLITFAADSNVPEAMEKLVSMYEEGHGVERDYRIAVEWQRKLAEHWEKEYRKSHDTDAYRKLLIALCELGDRLSNMGELDVAENTYRRILELCEENSNGNTKSEEIRSYLQVCYMKLGGIYRKRGDIDKRESFYQKTLDLSRYGDPAAYIGLGDIHIDKGEPKEAEAFYQKGIALFELLMENIRKEEIVDDLPVNIRNDTSVNIQHNLSLSYEKLGNFYREYKGDMEKSVKFFQKSLALCERLAEETGTITAKIRLADNYENFGELCIQTGNLSGAEEFYHKALVLRELLVEKAGTMQVHGELATTYNKIGDIQKAHGDLDGAESFYQKGLNINERLMEESWIIETQYLLFESYERLGSLRYTKKDWYGAEEFYRKSIVLGELLMEESDRVPIRNDLSVIYRELGNLRKANGDLKRAEELYHKSIILIEPLAKNMGVTFRINLLENYSNLGEIRYELDDMDRAEEYYLNGIALGEQLLKETRNARGSLFLCSCYCGLAAIREPHGQNLLKKAFQCITSLSAQSPQVMGCSEISDIIKRMLKQTK